MAQPLFSRKIFLHQSTPISLKTVISMATDREYNQTPVKALVPCSHDQLLAFKVIILFFAAFMTANQSANKERKA